MVKQIVTTFPTKTFPYPVNSFLVFTLLETQQKLPNFLPSSLFPLLLSRFLQPSQSNLTPLVNFAGLKSQSLLNCPDKCLICHISNCFVFRAFPLCSACVKVWQPQFLFSSFLPFSLSTVNLCSSPGEVWQPQFHTTSNFLCRSTQSP